MDGVCAAWGDGGDGMDISFLESCVGWLGFKEIDLGARVGLSKWARGRARGRSHGELLVQPWPIAAPSCPSRYVGATQRGKVDNLGQEDATHPLRVLLDKQTLVVIYLSALRSCKGREGEIESQAKTGAQRR